MSQLSRRGTPPSVRRRRALVAAGGLLMLVVLVAAIHAGAGRDATAATPGDLLPAQPSTAPADSPLTAPAPAPAPGFDRAAHSNDDPDRIWVVVDKLRALTPADYIPGDLVDVPVPFANPPRLRQEASAAVVSLFSAFTAETGLALQSQSAYRSFEAQTRVYERGVVALGPARADLSTARPGTSEHQTGLTIDISAQPGQCSLDVCFGDTPHGQWLAANAWRFGFLLRYPADKVEITGYGFEPWHFRYTGIELATEMHNTGVSTLEEFFGLPAAPSYG